MGFGKIFAKFKVKTSKKKSRLWGTIFHAKFTKSNVRIVDCKQLTESMVQYFPPLKYAIDHNAWNFFNWRIEEKRCCLLLPTLWYFFSHAKKIYGK